MPVLSLNSQKTLLRLARDSMQHYLEAGDILPYANPDPEVSLRRGCFVTLRMKGKLRGCVGTFDADQPLHENVQRMAVAAAFQDTRFPPVSKSDLKNIRIEISVLGELERIKSFNEIEIGKHGVYVKLGGRSGTYLPDVAVEQKWQVVEFVTYCAREKAGLAPEECARAEVFRYEVEKFED